MTLDTTRAVLAAKLHSGSQLTPHEQNEAALRLENPDLTFLHHLNYLIDREGNDDRRKFYQRLKGNVQKFIDL